VAFQGSGPSLLGAGSVKIGRVRVMQALPLTVLALALAASGPSVAGSLVATPGPADFGLVSVSAGSTSIQVTISNTGTNTEVTGFSPGAGCAEFAVPTNQLPVVLGNGGSLVLDIGYDPVDRTADACQVTTLSTGTGGNFTLQGDGSAAVLGTQTTVLNFASQRWNGGTPEVLNISIQNLGEESIAVANLSVGLVSGTQFSIGIPSGFPIGTGESATVPVTFDPSSAGPKSDTVIVSVNNDPPADPNDQVSLSGTGTQSIQTFSSPGLVIGSFPAGSGSGTGNLGIGNSGGASLNITSVAILGKGAVDFTFEDHGCSGQGPCLPSPATIGPGGSPEQFSIRCSPSEVGIRTASLEVESDDPQSPRSINLECTGAEPVELIFADGFE
jgi:hypothetical protein